MESYELACKSSQRRDVLSMVGTTLLVFGIGMACASTPRGRARQAAVIQKMAVDGVGNGYLSYCKIVRKPKCVQEDVASRASGSFPTKEERVACLKPCDSATAETIQTGVDIVRTAQTGLFELIKSPDVTEDELKAQREQLRRASKQLFDLLSDHGIMDLLGDAVGGGR